MAYYALASHQIERQAVPPRLGRGGPDHIPAVLIGKLALHSNLQGQQLGGQLLADALDRILTATAIVAARVVVVDAIDEEAASFYEHFGFTRTAPTSLRLYRKVSDIARDFEESG